MEKTIKCVLVGDSMVGKTHMWLRYGTNQIPKVKEQTLHDNYSITLQVNQKDVVLNVTDTGGIEDLDRLRPQMYPGANVIIVCFDVTEPASFQNVTDKWWLNLKHYCPNVPFILVGTKSELRNNVRIIERLRKRRTPPITAEQGANLAKEIGAVCYLECDAHEGVGLKNVFDWVVRTGYTHDQKSKEGKHKKLPLCLRGEEDIEEERYEREDAS